MDKTKFPFNIVHAIYGDQFDIYAPNTYYKGLENEIEQMGDDMKRIVHLHYKDGLTIKRIAEKENTSTHRISTILNRFIRRMHVAYRKRNIQAVSATDMKRVLDENDTLKQEVIHLQQTLQRTLNGQLTRKDVVFHAGGITGTTITTKDDTVKELRETSISMLGVIGTKNTSTRVYNALLRNNIRSIGDLLDTDEDELKRMSGIGTDSLAALMPKIHAIREQIGQTEVTP